MKFDKKIEKKKLLLLGGLGLKNPHGLGGGQPKTKFVHKGGEEGSKMSKNLSPWFMDKWI